MIEIKRCSISGIAFSMDAEAHATLRAYLDTLKERYDQEPDGKEIIADIEARIAELILSTQDNNRVVEHPLIKNIIAQLGSADAISEESDTEGAKPRQQDPRIPRRLYRDMERAKLGGVCAGVASYFDIDPVWIRLAIFAPLLLMPLSGINVLLWLANICGSVFGMFILTYLVLWFAIPAARSPRQRLEMKGEKITEQSIRENAAANTNSDADTQARPVVANTVTALGGCLLAIFKIVAAFIIFGLTMTILALLVGLVAIVATGGDMLDFGSLNEVLTLTGSEIAISVLGILIVIIPAVLLLYVLVCLFISRKPSRTVSITLFVVWILLFLALCFTSISTIHSIHSLNDVEQIEDAIESRIEQIEHAAEIIQDTTQSGGSVTVTTPNGTRIDISDIRKSGGTFRQTEINIDK